MIYNILKFVKPSVFVAVLQLNKPCVIRVPVTDPIIYGDVKFILPKIVRLFTEPEQGSNNLLISLATGEREEILKVDPTINQFSGWDDTVGFNPLQDFEILEGV